jgi:hypothetical protein
MSASSYAQEGDWGPPSGSDSFYNQFLDDVAETGIPQIHDDMSGYFNLSSSSEFTSSSLQQRSEPPNQFQYDMYVLFGASDTPKTFSVQKGAKWRHPACVIATPLL